MTAETGTAGAAMATGAGSGGGAPAGVGAVQVRGLTKTFGSEDTRVEALRGVDLEVRKGEFLAVMGPSGSGKSTLLHLVGGLDRPTSGRVLIAGEDLGAMTDDALTLLRRRRIGFVFQFFNLLPILSALENVTLPLIIDGVREADAERAAVDAMELVGVAHRRSHRPGELSGGEQQRVAIARALVAEPVFLLTDEPTGNLDSAMGDQVMALLRRLVDERRQTIMMVTHDPRAAAIADRLVLLKDGRVAGEYVLPAGGGAAGVLRRLEGLE